MASPWTGLLPRYPDYLDARGGSANPVAPASPPTLLSARQCGTRWDELGVPLPILSLQAGGGGPARTLGPRRRPRLFSIGLPPSHPPHLFLFFSMILNAHDTPSLYENLRCTSSVYFFSPSFRLLSGKIRRWLALHRTPVEPKQVDRPLVKASLTPLVSTAPSQRRKGLPSDSSLLSGESDTGPSNSETLSYV